MRYGRIKFYNNAIEKIPFACVPLAGIVCSQTPAYQEFVIFSHGLGSLV